MAKAPTGKDGMGQHVSGYAMDSEPAAGYNFVDVQFDDVSTGTAGVFTTRRRLREAYGYRIVFDVTGRARQFDIPSFLLCLATAFSLLVISWLVVEQVRAHLEFRYRGDGVRAAYRKQGPVPLKSGHSQRGGEYGAWTGDADASSGSGGGSGGGGGGGGGTYSPPKVPEPATDPEGNGDPEGGGDKAPEESEAPEEPMEPPAPGATEKKEE